ncbi:hypothetical protein JM658_05565 [Joostella atrarenae]|uniref:Uncharacterized protein n=1 Tax=Joostella atrarenae TaxID=679257 RepID=A0ABS9J1J3_9FLAO|nr:hypothetical protein [Joostella atrarenae]MCF8714292.1 hypothetical protein [Joostella atrarenae]
MKESDLKILQKSLKMIAYFPERVDTVNSANEFINIHNRNLKMLTDLGIERKSTFIKKRIEEYPTINTTEIEYYITKQKKERSLLSVVGGIVIDFVYDVIKNKGTTLPQIKRKLNESKSLNEKIQKVIEDPIYEELYEKTMHNNVSY